MNYFHVVGCFCWIVETGSCDRVNIVYEMFRLCQFLEITVYSVYLSWRCWGVLMPRARKKADYATDFLMVRSWFDKKCVKLLVLVGFL